MADEWKPDGTDHITVITATIWNGLKNYVLGHKNEHVSGGIDPIPTVTKTKTGLCPVLSDSSTQYLNGKGVFSAISSGTVGGDVGATDNAVPRADGTGGITLQSSLVTIDDSGSVNIPAAQTYKINGTALAYGNITGAAPLASPTFTGTPKITTTPNGLTPHAIADIEYVAANAGTATPAYDYIIYYCAPDYVAKDKGGTVIATSTAFHSMLNDFFAAATSGTTIVIAPGTYTYTDGMTAVTGKSFTIYAYGAKIVTTSGLYNHRCLTFSGTAKTATLLTETPAIDDTSVRVASIANITKGDLIKIRDDTYMVPLTYDDKAQRGEMSRVFATGVMPSGASFTMGVGTSTTEIVCAELSGTTDAYNGMRVYNITRSAALGTPKWGRVIAYDSGTHTLTLDEAISGQVATNTFYMPVILEDSLRAAYDITVVAAPATSGNAAAVPITPITINVYGLTLEMYDATKSYYGIHVKYGVNCNFRDCTIINGGYAGFDLEDCYNVVINGCHITHAEKYGMGYGVCLSDACRNVLINQNTIKNCRHTTCVGSSGAGSYGGTANLYISDNILVGNGMLHAVDCHVAWDFYLINNEIDVADTNLTGLDGDAGMGCRTGAHKVIVEGNVFRNVSSSVFSTRQQMSNQSIIIRGNKIYGNNQGETYIMYLNDNDHGTFDEIVIEDNECWQTAGLVHLYESVIDRITIRNNTQHTTSSKSVTSPSDTTYGIRLTAYSNVTVEGNIIRNQAYSGIYLNGCTGVCRNNTIINPSRYAAATTHVGIHLVGTTAIQMLVEGNWIECTDTEMTYGIDEVTTAANHTNTIRNNIIIGAQTADYLIIGDNTTGLIKQGRTSIADGGTITHGLSATPTWAIVTPITAGEFATVTTLGATTLTVAIKKHDNSAGTTQFVSWMCGL